MYRGHSVGVVVPAFNEAESIGAVLRGQPAFVDTVVAVDDGSTDGTCDVIERIADAPGGPEVDAVCHEANQGAGAAILTGYRRCREAGFDLVVTVDADGQMDLDRMEHLLAPLVEGDADFSKGDRLRSEEHREEMPLHRIVGNGLLTLFTRVASGCAVSDPQNGYTAITSDLLASLDLDGVPSNHSYCNALLVQFGALDATIVDVPMPAIYGEESSTISYPGFVATTLLVLSVGWLRRLPPSGPTTGSARTAAGE